MDKNFVNIDDLVRQRLGGGEEQERSGAWMNMRDLLDKEMPQEDRAGFFYWRRMMSAVAVLLLIASISMGGYELSASRNARLAANSDAVTPQSSKSTNAPIASDETNKDQLTATGIAPNSQNKNDNQDTKNTIAVSNNHNNNQSKNKQNRRHSISTPVESNKTTAGNAPVNNDQVAIATNKTASNDNLPIAAASNATSKENTSVAEKVAVNEPGAKSGSANKNTNDLATVTHRSGHKTKTAKTTGISTPKVGAITASIAAVSSTPAGEPAGTTGVKTLGSMPAKTDSKPLAGLVKHSGHKTAGAKTRTQKMNSLAMGSHSIAVSKPKAAGVGVSKTSIPGITTQSVAGKTPSGTHAISGKGKNGALAKTKPGIAQKIASKNGPGLVSAKHLAVASAPSATSGVTKTKTGTAAVATVSKVGKNAPVAREEKKAMQKLVIYEHEHYIKTDPENGYFNYDTISMHTLSQDMAVAEENSPAQPAEKPATARKSATPATTTTTASNSVAAAGNSTTNAESQILPGASASASGKPALTQKESAAGSKSAGSAAIANLASSFNDIKYNIKGMQFAAGLTGGINGTFFGPSTFKGFQFGITGDFIFGDSWSLGTELKYFQRINNNYSLNDDASVSTRNPNGLYNVQQTTNTYSFSTLHSIEMPLIVRYTNGKFNFFVGGNLVYTFAINEGYLQTQTTSTATTNEPNSQMKIDPTSDFNARFGVGCLFGLSYNIAPNLKIDLRNVMTLWDNASTTGSKYVSEQLYKSPSLQLSVGYRLGGNKHKE